MKNCVYCNRRLPVRQRKYCGKECLKRFQAEGPAREQFVYHETPIETDAEVLELQHRVDTGTWMLFPAASDDEQCTGDFMRVFKRAPKYVIFDPRTPMWKFAGPVWTTEENERRWQGYEEVKAKRSTKIGKAKKSTDLRSKDAK